jgi:O-methyltransferase
MYLRSEVPGSRAAWVRNALRPPIWQAWEHLLHTVRTGEIAFGHIHGEDVWTFRSRVGDDSAIFDLAMREGSLRVGVDLLSCYDFTQFRHIVDVGGGDGTLLATLLAGSTETSGTLFDQSHVIARASDVFHRAGVSRRCSIVAGSFFDAVPTGANAYLLKFILHDWDDDHCASILTNCRRAMAGHSRLLIVERLLALPNEGLEAKLSDLNMMVNLGGQERSREEFSALLQRAGLTLRRVIALPGRLSLLEVM